MNSWPNCIVLAFTTTIRVRSPVQIPYFFNDAISMQSIYVVCPVTLCILWQINLSSGYPDQRSWTNVEEKRNEIQSPEKDLLLMTSWDPFSVPSTSKVHLMRRDKDRYEISAKRTLAIRKRRPRNVNLGICYVPSTSQTSQSDVFWTSMGLHCAIWVIAGKEQEWSGRQGLSTKLAFRRFHK
jgi:hypothetical protein